ncbi:hypothetical protein [Metabacillus sp. SLBN-84]
MTSTLTKFKTSINIKFDLGKKEFVDRYLPTPSHADSLLGLLKGFNKPNNNRSHIIVGPYGTGKSLIATILGNITSKKIDKKTLNTLTNKFDKVHYDIHSELQEVKHLEETYLTVVLNGYEGRFREAILNAIIRTINDNKIDIVLPGQFGKIIQVISQWENEYPKTYKEFKRLLKDNNKDLKLWRLSVMNQDKFEIDWFLSIYSQLSSGANFVVEYNENFTDQISHVLKELKKQDIGLFITYDEFGRLLQTLDSNDIHETMQDLQDLAELVDHYSDNLHVLLITHRNLRQYFSFLGEDLKNEFQRIEKRFRVYYVESDKSTFIRLADNIIQEHSIDIILDSEKDQTVKHYLRKYPLFPELNQQEIEKIIVKGIYPLHPVALYLLPFLSSSYGQNERTLFTFLESEETGGLLNHLVKSKEYYLASDLFNYFFSNIHDMDISGEGFESLKLYKGIVNKTPHLVDNFYGIKLLKLVTLWQLAGLQSRIKLDTEFLCFALNLNSEAISLLLKELSVLKIIRYNRVLGYWELLEGSSFQIEELITERIAQSALTERKRLELLGKCLPKHFFFANEYNDQKSITRYATVKLISSTDIINETLNFRDIRERSKSDAVIYYVLIQGPGDASIVVEKLKQIEDVLSLFCISKLPFTAIQEQLTEYSIIETLLEDAELLSQDKSLKQELILKKEDTNFILDDFLSKYTTYSKDTLWVHNGKSIDIKSEIILENKLSSIMFETFPYTPEVRNDSFNRRKLNNVQKKAGHDVLDHIINNYSEEDFGINGKGPDYLIYATIFKNNELDITNLNEIKKIEFEILRSKLLAHIEQFNTGSLEDFVEIMRGKPFGIREPLIPIFLVSLLRDKWDQLMFYRNDMYVSGINGEKLYKMFEEASEYSFLYYNFQEQFEEFFVGIERMFNEFENDLVKNKPRIIRINNAILTWLRKLPRLTQITDNLNSDLLWLKNNIKKSEINPQESLTELYSRYSNDLSELEKHRLQLENYFNEFKLKLKKDILTLINVSSFEELNKWAKEQTPEVQKKNKLVNSIIKLNKHKWEDSFAFSFLGIEIEAWSDTTTEMFKSQLKVEFESIKQSDQINDKNIQIIYNGNVKYINSVELSTKSQTIYNNVSRMISNAGRNVPKEEVEYMIYKLMEDFVE